MIRPKKIDNVLIDVPDVQQAVLWYQENVGLEVAVNQPEVAVLHTADERGAGIVLRRNDSTSNATVWFEVPNAVTVAKSMGLPVFGVATGLCVEIQDPWGNTVGFTDYSGSSMSCHM